MVQEKLNAKKHNHQNQPLKLIDQSRSFQSTKRLEFTLISLTDLILYVLDTAVNLSSFLSIYKPACAILHSLHFETRYFITVITVICIIMFVKFVIYKQ